MKECPYCGVSVGGSDSRCWHCDADLQDREKTDEGMLQDFLAFPEEVSDIIGEYGLLLDKMGREHNPRLLRPLSGLPYPKEEIEAALTTALGIAKNETLRNRLETALLFLDDFIPDDEVPQDADENLESWLSRKDWQNPQARDLLAMTLAKIFIEEYGDKAVQKLEEFMEDWKRHSKTEK